MIQLVVVVDENNGIGKDNQLLCHLPADLKHFKAVTVGFPVIMGRKTFESMGKPLINRRNIVISSNDITIDGAEVLHSLREAITACDDEKISIIGGGEIFRQAIEFADQIELTLIHHRFNADTFFPEIDLNLWKETSTERHSSDEKNLFDYSFITYQKRS
ncbi:dihydrofolate reductase [Pedobacter sp. HMF7647]|uniref:Dihydrofolate reductase n=1 Tax=Hufsiella arboris TaxID=2695275 RepID=A0A7K1YD53_9SPHI|nr:dihydrofolate reductase [Hufsiella arboris]MXV52517.1 dihydrofolate reductase [Hufsiella arboris]